MARHRRVAAALLTSTCLAAAGIVSAPGAVRAQQDPASRALLYVQSQQSPRDGSIPSALSPFGASEDDVMALAAAGYDPAAVRHGGPSVLAYLEANVAAASASPGGCAQLVLALVAAGVDPHAVAGGDLVARLLGDLHAASGAFGDGEAFTQTLGIEALVAAGHPVPPAALRLLQAAQDSDGGWDYRDLRDDTNPQDYDSSDTNSTAMALMALDAAGDHSRDASGLRFLHTQQDADAGFPYQLGDGTDPDSTALVVQAILATGGDPAGPAWTVSRGSPWSTLLGLQAGGGGFTYPGDSGPDPATTAAVALGLLRQPLPVHATFAAGFSAAGEARSVLSGLRFLQAQLSSDGSLAGSGDDAELFAIDSAAAGYDPATLRRDNGRSVVAYLRGHAASLCDSAAHCGRLLQAVLATGASPQSFGGVDLVTRLDATYAARSGAFGDGEAFTQSLALQALLAADQPVPAAALRFLRAAQDSDGGWDYRDLRDDTNPQDYDSSDTNSTAMVLMALDAAGDHSRDAAALRFLRTQQEADGGFAFQAGPGAFSDPASTALVLQALCGAGQDPAARSWSRGGSDAITYLVRTQAGDGGWAYPGESPDVLDTAQVPVALERLAFPVDFAARSFYVRGTALGQTAPGGPSPPAPASTGPAAGVVTAAAGAPPRPAPSTTAAPAGGAAPSPTRPRPLPAAGSPTPPAPAALLPAPRPPVGVLPAPSGGGWPAALVYALAALAAAVLVGGAGLAWSRRR